MSLEANEEAAKRYRKVREVGEGTYGVVFEAVERASGRRVAIKKMKVSGLRRTS